MCVIYNYVSVLIIGILFFFFFNLHHKLDLHETVLIVFLQGVMQARNIMLIYGHMEQQEICTSLAYTQTLYLYQLYHYFTIMCRILKY